ncbi:uncharacterized protein LOC110887757 [Helianthus annuus]|uniref:uncharacterized protein LOC110887757 n=1 Tax=Helianthus annuus TaxID=4232 RepID=UPI000B900C31|nr:uncharacterized protein LOC110887757 [Helianthus annuus]
MGVLVGRWVHLYSLKGRNFWECKSSSNCCWSWRKLLQLRPIVRKHVWSKIGDGNSTSAWYNYWCEGGSLSTFLTPRVITNAGFSLHSMVSDVSVNGTWVWPMAWREVYPVLLKITPYQLNPHSTDCLLWKDENDLHEYSSSTVWQSIRYREPEVDWVNIVWFAQCIPRHVFLMWLVMRRKLLTQDKILQWDFSRRKSMNMMYCLLCYENYDSHDNLFFERKLSTQVWKAVRDKAGMKDVDEKWSSIVDWLSVCARSKSAANYVSRLIVAASVYVIWQERNARLFKNQKAPDIIATTILSTVRYKIMGAKFKNTASARRLLGDWEISDEGATDGIG